MAGSELPPFDLDAMKGAQCCFMGHSVEPAKMEAWVKKISAETGITMDWKFVGGRACVYALGDLDAACEAFEARRQEYENLQMASYRDR